MQEPMIEPSGGLNRRDVLRRGAILGGALVWTVPAVQTLSGPAFAAGTPCIGRVEFSYGRGLCLFVQYRADETCCDCVTTTAAQLANTAGGDPTIFIAAAAAICQGTGRCQVQSFGTC